LAFYGEDTVVISTVHWWVRISRDCGRNVDLNVQPHSGRPVTATYYVKRQKLNILKKKNRRIFQRAIVQKLNTGLAHINENIKDLDYTKNMCSMGATSPYAQNKDSRLEAWNLLQK